MALICVDCFLWSVEHIGNQSLIYTFIEAMVPWNLMSGSMGLFLWLQRISYLTVVTSPNIPIFSFYIAKTEGQASTYIGKSITKPRQRSYSQTQCLKYHSGLVQRLILQF